MSMDSMAFKWRRLIVQYITGIDQCAVKSRIDRFLRNPSFIFADRAFNISVALLFFCLFLSLITHVFSLSYQQWITPTYSMYCADHSGLKVVCDTRQIDLHDGRYRLSANHIGDKRLNIKIRFEQGIVVPKYLVLRKGFFVLGNDETTETINSTVKSDGEYTNNFKLTGPRNGTNDRVVIELPKTQSSELLLVLSNGEGSSEVANLILDEIGFTNVKPSYPNAKPYTWFKKYSVSKHHGNIFMLYHLMVILFVAKIFIVYLLRAYSQRLALETRMTALSETLFVLSGGLLILAAKLWTDFGDGMRDLRITFASGTLLEGAGANLNYALYMAQSILAGHGPLIVSQPPWHRMPGYAGLIALSGIFSQDLLQLAMNGMVWQLIFFASSGAVLYHFARKIMPAYIAAVAVFLVLNSRNQLFYIQIESIMPAIAMLVLAGGCVFLAEIRKNRNGQMPSFKYHVPLHLAFALWFSIRPDVVPGWIAVSLILYCRSLKTLKYLALPCLGLAIIGGSWGLFKYPYIHTFSPTTQSVGASLMIGLWEVPSKFAWTVSDGAYHEWINNMAHLPSMSKEASDYAVKEVSRFIVTYPGYIVSLVWHKFVGFMTMMSSMFGIPLLGTALGLSTLFGAVVMGYQTVQTTLLGWAVLFNLPFFLVLYSSAGRFYNVSYMSMIFAVLPLWSDINFYKALMQRLWLLALILACTFVFAYKGVAIDNYIMSLDKFRYATPFLNPGDSSLVVFK